MSASSCDLPQGGEQRVGSRQPEEVRSSSDPLKNNKFVSCRCAAFDGLAVVPSPFAQRLCCRRASLRLSEILGRISCRMAGMDRRQSAAVSPSSAMLANSASCGLPAHQIENRVLICAVASRLVSIFALPSTMQSLASSVVPSIASSTMPCVASGMAVPFGILPLILDVGGRLVQEAPPGHLRAHLTFELLSMVPSVGSPQALSCHFLACFL
jgi:hypothetical protein